MKEKPNATYEEGLRQLVRALHDMLPPEQFAVFNNDAAKLAREFPTPLKLQRGDRAPLFSLPNATGKTVLLQECLRQGAVVLTFYRGSWCPYCNLQLKLYQGILPQIRQAGAQLLAISPMTPGHGLGMQETNALQFEVLSDVGNQVARDYTTVFRNDAAPLQAMQDLGYDFFSFYGDGSAEIPVPATFVIARDGTIVLAETLGGDYRGRVEPQAILDALREAG